MKSIIISYAAAIAVGLLAAPAFADPGHTEHEINEGLFSMIFSVGSVVLIIGGCWILYASRKHKPKK